MKTVKLSKILKDLQADGWYEVRQRGSHRQFKHPVKKGTVTNLFSHLLERTH